MAHLELKLPVKLVLFKLFDRQVMASLKDFLVEGNKRLSDMGVLPDLEQLRKARAEPRQQEKPRRRHRNRRLWLALHIPPLPRLFHYPGFRF